MNDIRDITHRADYSSPMRLIGAILAQGVIRLQIRQRRDNLVQSAALRVDPTINLKPPQGTKGTEFYEIEPASSNSKQGFEPLAKKHCTELREGAQNLGPMSAV